MAREQNQKTEASSVPDHASDHPTITPTMPPTMPPKFTPQSPHNHSTITLKLPGSCQARRELCASMWTPRLFDASFTLRSPQLMVLGEFSPLPPSLRCSNPPIP